MRALRPVRAVTVVAYAVAGATVACRCSSVRATPVVASATAATVMIAPVCAVMIAPTRVMITATCMVMIAATCMVIATTRMSPSARTMALTCTTLVLGSDVARGIVIPVSVPEARSGRRHSGNRGVV